MSINYIVSEYVAKPVEDVLVFTGSLIVSHGFWIPTGVKLYFLVLPTHQSPPTLL